MLPTSAAVRAPDTRQVTADPCLCCWRHSNTQRQVWLSFCGLWVLVCKRFCLSPLSISGRYWFDTTWNFPSPTILLGICLCSWPWGIFIWWDLTFSCRWCSAVSCNLGVLAGEDECTECTSFYSAILTHLPAGASEEGMATHASNLAGRITWTEGPGSL